ncbi:FKBP-type peptidyl-prolyl cis-trans isomerase [Frateuria aurantia]
MSRALGLTMLLVCGLWIGPAAAQDAGQAKAQAGSRVVPLDRHKLSYTIGYQIGSQFAGGDPAIDLATLEHAIEDAYYRRAPSVATQDMREQLQALDAHMHHQAESDFQRIADTNAHNSALYLSRNRQRPGVITLPSGIQYRVVENGKGAAQPTLTSTVTINYRGMLVDGTEFDSSWAHGAPVSFVVNQVIPGWREVLPRMHVGDRWSVVIPPELAFGVRGEMPRIGPNEALIFDIELISVKP